MTPKKELLLISPKLTGYEEVLIEKLTERNYTAHFYSAGIKMPRNEISWFWRGIRGLAIYLNIRSLLLLLQLKEKKYYANSLSKLPSPFDVVLIFGGKLANLNCLKQLKENGVRKTIIFLWDDLQDIRITENSLGLCDEKFSFSTGDVGKHGIKFRPSFYHPMFEYNGEEKNIDIYYKANIRDKERVTLIKAIDDATPNYKKEINFFSKKKSKKDLNRFDSSSSYDKYCVNTYSSTEEIAIKSKHSKVLIDICFQNQKGLGLRAIEAIGSNCKLITTNTEIKKYDFYNTNNIFLLENDLSNLNKLEAFLKSPYLPLSKEEKVKYTANGFLDDLGLKSEIRDL